MKTLKESIELVAKEIEENRYHDHMMGGYGYRLGSDKEAKVISLIYGVDYETVKNTIEKMIDKIKKNIDFH